MRWTALSCLLPDMAVHDSASDGPQPAWHQRKHALRYIQLPACARIQRNTLWKSPVDEALRLRDPVVLEREKSGVMLLSPAQIKMARAIRFRRSDSFPQ